VGNGQPPASRCAQPRGWGLRADPGPCAQEQSQDPWELNQDTWERSWDPQELNWDPQKLNQDPQEPNWDPRG